MAANLGNQFWRNRSKHGRDVIFNDPELLWQQAAEYFDWCDQNPLLTVEFNGKDATECIVPKMRAYTKTGLCVYLDCCLNTFESLKDKKDFLNIYTRICQIIYSQKFEGAAGGLLNASIIARDLGLAEKTENSNMTNVSEDILKALVEKINA